MAPKYYNNTHITGPPGPQTPHSHHHGPPHTGNNNGVVVMEVMMMMVVTVSWTPFLVLISSAELSTETSPAPD